MAQADEYGQAILDMLNNFEDFMGNKSFENTHTKINTILTSKCKGVFINNQQIDFRHDDDVFSWSITQPTIVRVYLIISCVRDSFDTHEIKIATIKIDEWNFETRREALLKGLKMTYNDFRCVCSTIIEAEGLCERCKRIVFKTPCEICKKRRGHMKVRKRKNKRVFFHKECKRQKMY